MIWGEALFGALLIWMIERSAVQDRKKMSQKKDPSVMVEVVQILIGATILTAVLLVILYLWAGSTHNPGA